MQQPLFRFEIENFLLATDNVWDDICTLTVTGPSEERSQFSNIRYKRPDMRGVEETKTWMVAQWHTSLLSLVSTDMSPVVRAHHQGDISQSEESSQSTDQSEARGQSPISFCDNPRSVLMNVYTSAALRADTLGNEWGLCSQWGKGLRVFESKRVRDVPISRVSAVSPDPCCDVNIYREWHKTSWSALRQSEAMIVWGWPMRGQGVLVTVTGTGHCPPVTQPPAPAPINREMPLSGQQRWHYITANQRLDDQLLANQRRVWGDH